MPPPPPPWAGALALLAPLRAPTAHAHASALAHSAGQRALRHDGGVLAARGLWETVARVAEGLRAMVMGDGEGATVAVACASGWPLLVSMFAAALANMPFVPVDLTHPRERVKHILAVAAPCAVLVFDPRDGTEARDAAFALHARAKSIDEITAASDANPTRTAPTTQPSPTHPCYVVFTSGSAGQPKGVVCSQGAIGAFACAKAAADRLVGTNYDGPNECLRDAVRYECALQRPAVAPRSDETVDEHVVMLVAAHTFDLTQGDAFSALVAIGANTSPCTSLAAPRRERVRMHLVKTINAYGATHLSLTPAVWLLAGAEAGVGPSPEAVPTLRCVSLGGEPLPSRVAAQWQGIVRALPGSNDGYPVLRNIYGATEATDVQCFADVAVGHVGSCVGRPYACAVVLVVSHAESDSELSVDEAALGVPPLRMDSLPCMASRDGGAVAPLRLCTEGAVGRVVMGGAGVLGCGYVSEGTPLFYGADGVAALSTVTSVGTMGYLGVHSRFGPLFDTGDLGRWEGDGLHLVGRADDLVKVHGGNRVRLGDVEAKLRALPIVGTAACTTLPEHDGSLAAHVALVEEVDLGEMVDNVDLVWAYRRAAATALRHRLARLLPHAHVPSVWIAMGGAHVTGSPGVPYTESGKVDRRVLKERHAVAMKRTRGPTGGEEAFQPQDAVEAIVAEIWAEALGFEHLPRGSSGIATAGLVDIPLAARDGAPNFLHLGGTSLHALRCCQMLARRLGSREAATVAAATAEHFAAGAPGVGRAGGAEAAAPPSPAGPACVFGEALGALAPHELLRRPDFFDFVAYVRDLLADRPPSKASDRSAQAGGDYATGDLLRTLNWASARGCPRLTATLLGAGATATDGALLAACASGHPSAPRIVRLLLLSGASALSSECMHIAFARGHAAVVRAVLQHVGTAEGCAELISQVGAAGRTPVHYGAMAVEGGDACLALAHAAVRGEQLAADRDDDARLIEERAWLTSSGVQVVEPAPVWGRLDDTACLWNPVGDGGSTPADVAAQHGNLKALVALRDMGGETRTHADVASLLLSDDAGEASSQSLGRTQYAPKPRTGFAPERAARKEGNDALAISRLLSAVCDATARAWQGTGSPPPLPGSPDIRSAAESLRNLVCANAENRRTALEAGAADKLAACVARLSILTGAVAADDAFADVLVRFAEPGTPPVIRPLPAMHGEAVTHLLRGGLREILGTIRNLAFGGGGGKAAVRGSGVVPLLCELAVRGAASADDPDVSASDVRIEVGRKAAGALMSCMQGDAENRHLVASHDGAVGAISRFFASGGKRADSATLTRLTTYL